MEKKRLTRCKKKQKKRKNFIRKIFLHFGLQIYGLQQTQVLTPLITLYGVF